MEGIFALLDPRVLELVDLKIFVDTSLDVCLARRLTRDVIYRNREIDLSILQWQRFVKPNFELHVRPSMRNADVLIPRGIDNIVAIDLLMAHIQRQLEKKSLEHMTYLLSLSDTQDNSAVSSEIVAEDCALENKDTEFNITPSLPNLITLKETPQLRALNTFILACGSEISFKDSQIPIHTNADVSSGQNKAKPLPTIRSSDPYGPLKKFFSASSTPKASFDRADFVFHFDRIATILIGRALDEFSYGSGSGLYNDNKTPVVTPGGFTLKNATRLLSQPAAVELLRGGECFDTALRKTIRDIPLGKILIQSDAKTGEPHLHSLSLPPCVDPRVNNKSSPSKNEEKDDSDSSSQISHDAHASDKLYVELNRNDIKLQRKTKILLCDSQLSSGAAVTMSVAILIDHGIKEEDIVIVAYMATHIAIQRLYSAYPSVKVVVGLVTHAAVPRFVDNVYFGTV